MKIIHILEDYSLSSGGIRTVVKRLHQKLISLGFESTIISCTQEKDDNIVLVDGVNTPWRYSSDWTKILKKIYNKSGIEIIHIHGVWMYPQYIAAKFALANKIPFIVSPHGMYEPWLWTKGGFKKKFYFNYMVKKLFVKATRIHTITSQESKNIQQLFGKIKTFEIPNLIDDEYLNIEVLPYNNKEKYMLYLGRIDKKKGIDLLIRAFSKIQNNPFKLKIAGSFTDYKKELDQLIASLNISSDKIEFLGRITGQEKINLFAQAFVFVAPSYSEVVGMVNLEAAALKTPVITTHQTGLDPEWSSYGGMLINPDITELTNALVAISQWSVKDRITYGNQLEKFVKERYSWKNRLEDWQTLYNTVLKNNN